MSSSQQQLSQQQQTRIYKRIREICEKSLVDLPVAKDLPRLAKKFRLFFVGHDVPLSLRRVTSQPRPATRQPSSSPTSTSANSSETNHNVDYDDDDGVRVLGHAGRTDSSSLAVGDSMDLGSAAMDLEGLSISVAPAINRRVLPDALSDNDLDVHSMRLLASGEAIGAEQISYLDLSDQYMERYMQHRQRQQQAQAAAAAAATSTAAAAQDDGTTPSDAGAVRSPRPSSADTAAEASSDTSAEGDGDGLQLVLPSVAATMTDDEVEQQTVVYFLVRTLYQLLASLAALPPASNFPELEEYHAVVNVNDHSTLTDFITSNFGDYHPLTKMLKSAQQTIVINVLFLAREMLMKCTPLQFKDVRGQWRVVVKFCPSSGRVQLMHKRTEEVYVKRSPAEIKAAAMAQATGKAQPGSGGGMFRTLFRFTWRVAIEFDANNDMSISNIRADLVELIFEKGQDEKQYEHEVNVLQELFRQMNLPGEGPINLLEHESARILLKKMQQDGIAPEGTPTLGQLKHKSEPVPISQKNGHPGAAVHSGSSASSASSQLSSSYPQDGFNNRRFSFIPSFLRRGEQHVAPADRTSLSPMSPQGSFRRIPSMASILHGRDGSGHASPVSHSPAEFKPVVYPAAPQLFPSTAGLQGIWDWMCHQDSSLGEPRQPSQQVPAADAVEGSAASPVSSQGTPGDVPPINCFQFLAMYIATRLERLYRGPDADERHVKWLQQGGAARKAQSAATGEQRPVPSGNTAAHVTGQQPGAPGKESEANSQSVTPATAEAGVAESKDRLQGSVPDVDEQRPTAPGQATAAADSPPTSAT